MQALLLRAYLAAHGPHLRRQEGQTMGEYAVVLAVIVIVTVGVFATLGERIQGAIQQVVDVLPGGGGGGGE